MQDHQAGKHQALGRQMEGRSGGKNQVRYCRDNFCLPRDLGQAAVVLGVGVL